MSNEQPRPAVHLLRAWVGLAPRLDERPTRDDLKYWVRDLLGERETLLGERDSAREELRVEAEAHDADVDRLATERETLLGERDSARAARDRLIELARRRRARLDEANAEIAALRERLTKHAPTADEIAAKVTEALHADSSVIGFSVESDGDSVEIVTTQLVVTSDNAMRH